LQIRSYVKAIFAEAVDQDFLAKDPARSLKTPLICGKATKRL